MVIDDAEFILESTSTLLKLEGYEVYTVSDGLAGVEAARDKRPDLILCDISMPKLDGYGVLERVRSDPELATTPFVFLTAFTEKSNMRAGMERGADDFIVKPYTRDELIAAINAQWSKHSRIEKKMMEKVEEVGRNVTYALPHEFRTALNEVIGSAKYLSSAADSISPSDVKELSGDIVDGAKRLQKITENFLIFVRIESFASNPNKRAQLRTFRTAEAAAMVIDIAALVSEKFDRSTDLVYPEDFDSVSVEISTESFHKIIDEITDNAFRFSEPGTKVELSFERKGDFLYVSIKDHGRGMSEEQISSIAALAQFERTIYEQQGVGLGLVITKRLVELHDGAFEIIGEDKVGTVVKFSLPIAEEK